MDGNEGNRDLEEICEADITEEELEKLLAEQEKLLKTLEKLDENTELGMKILGDIQGHAQNIEKETGEQISKRINELNKNIEPLKKEIEISLSTMNLKSSSVINAPKKPFSSLKTPTSDFDVSYGNSFHLLSLNYTSGQFFINPKLPQVFPKPTANIAFVSVIGRKKIGKSLFLNRLLGLSDSAGFSVGGFNEGVWLWTTPVHLEKEGVSLYFLEFEGFASASEFSITEEKQLLLALTISSAIVIVSNGDQEQEFDRLLDVLSLFQDNVRVNDYDPPQFIWALREQEGAMRKKRSAFDPLAADEGPLVRALRYEALMFWFDERTPNGLGLFREKLFRKSKKELAGCTLGKELFMAVLERMVESLNSNVIVDINQMVYEFIEKDISAAVEASCAVFDDLRDRIEIGMIKENELNELLKENYELAIRLYMEKTFKYRDNVLYRPLYSASLEKINEFTSDFEKRIKIQFHETASVRVYNAFKRLIPTLTQDIISRGNSVKDMDLLAKSLDNALSKCDESFESNDIKFQTLKEFLPEILKSVFSALKKENAVEAEERTKEKSEIFLPEKRLLFSEVKKSKVPEISKSGIPKFNEEQLMENERLRSALIAKDRLIKEKDERIKYLEAQIQKTPSKSKKPVGCI